MRALWTWLAVPRGGWELAGFIVAALALGALALALLISIPPRYRKYVVMAVTFIAGLYYSIEFLIPRENLLTRWKPYVGDASLIIGSFTILLGVSNLFQIHGRAVSRRREGWYNSAAFFVAFFAIIVAGYLYQSRMTELTSLTAPATSAEYKAVASAAQADEQAFNILFRGFLTPLEATMFSLIAFYIVSAAYRAFRIRSAEATLLMLAAAIVMLALVPVGVILTSWIPATGILSAFRLENLGYWLLTSPNMAAQRAIGFGLGVGMFAMGLRIWLSLERGSFFDREL